MGANFSGASFNSRRSAQALFFLHTAHTKTRGPPNKHCLCPASVSRRARGTAALYCTVASCPGALQKE